MKECNLNKNKNLPKIGVVCQNAKRSFFGMFFFCFLVVLFFVACVFVLVFCKKAQKGYFPAILEVFCLFCSHKRPVLKCFFSSYFVFLLLSSLSKIHFLFAFYPSTPFYRRLFVGFLFFFFCLPFPFLRFACLFDTNFPNIPFLKSNLLSFLAVSFFCCSCFCFDCVCFSLSVFLLLCWLCFWCFFCFVLCFVFVFFLVLLSVYEKKLFSLQFWCFFELCWLKG